MSAHADAEAAASLELVTLAGLAVPWFALSLLLPSPWVALALCLCALLVLLLGAAAWWCRARAAQLGRDPEAWALAGVLSLGYAMALLVVPSGNGAPLEQLCPECGALTDVSVSFCPRCGAF